MKSNNPIFATLLVLVVILGGVGTSSASHTTESTLSPEPVEPSRNVTTFVAPYSLNSTLDLQALLSSRSRGGVVAREDFAVARFPVADLGSYYNNSAARDRLGSNEFALAIAPSNSSGAVPRWNSSADAVTVLPDIENNSLYALWRVPVDTTLGDYIVALAATGSGGDSDTESDASRVTFTVVERNVTIDVKGMAIAKVGYATFFGNTTVAPGTKLTLMADAPDDPTFPQTETVTVSDDGSFAARMDFSGASNGTEFSLFARGHPDSEVPGLVVAAPLPTTTATTGSTTATESASPSPKSITTSTRVETETSSGGQPGFGPAVTVIALLVASTLLGRKDPS